MAYAALVSLEQTIDKLLHYHNHQCPISPHDKQQLMFILDFITFLQAFLEDFPEKVNNFLEGWIRDVANEAEDIIEFGMFDQIKLYHSTLKSTGGPESHVMLHSDFKELNKVIMEIDSIRGEVMEIKINSTRSTKDVQLSTAYSSVATSSSRPIAPTNKDSMVGFDDDLMAVKARLCGESQNLEVIPIYGMGGIGKTTFARNAYDDPLTVEHFDIRAWVTVSQDYSTQEIFSSLLVSLKAGRSGGSIESMVQNVYQHLKGRRYLIIMDDMWSTKAWDDVKMMFPDDCNGSRIMLTTRLSDVAAYPDSSSPLHDMCFMNVDQSWNLLQQKVFGGENCPPELETIGKMIAKSCRGLPLAIVLIAGLLSTVSETQASWGNIAENVTSAISSTNDEQFAKMLSLSYAQLPPHLKPPFLFMGGFPEDYEIRASKLIKLWIAEGFLKPSASKSLEEEAEEYLEDLVKRSLVLVNKRKYNGKIKSCSVHDLVRDLCIRKAHEEKFHLNVLHSRRILPESIKNQRGLSIAFPDLDCLDNIYGSTIRTIIGFIIHYHAESSLSFLENFRLLRVLEVVPDRTDTLILPENPAELFELFHLRYFAFTYFYQNNFVIPPSILNLQNLQTLIIRPKKNVLNVSYFRMPKEIWRMRQLKHLIFGGPLANPEGAATSALENLQTFSKVANLKFTEEILKMIPNLKKLGIFYYGVDYTRDSHLENLVCLHQLEKLKLESYEFGSVQSMVNPVFPMMLKKLVLMGWGLPWKDMSIIGSLRNLEVLKLMNEACYGEKWETSEGEFSQLKYLVICGSSLKHWITESSHFPSLKWLKLYNCWYLREIPDGIGEIPTLEMIGVALNNESLLDSAKRIKEEQQQNYGDSTLHISTY